MVLVSKEEKRAIYQYLLQEGVIVVRKDPYLPRHQHIDKIKVPNLKVMMIVKSLKSQGYLQDVFNWQWSYYTVTNKGVNFLVKALGKFQTTILTHFRCPNRCCPRNLQEEEGLSCRCP